MPFRGHDLMLCPETDQLAPSVLLTYESAQMSMDAAQRLVREFLSSLSWAEGRPVQDLEAIGGTSPIWIGKGRGRMIAPNFRADYLPDPADPRSRRALALYREALYVNSRPYGFLGFFKILNVCFPDGGSQIAWINRVIDQLGDAAIKTRVAALRGEGKDIGVYLYGSGRCAVAHAWSDPIVDPDSPEDMRRLVQDLPVIRGLAEWAIERELGVKSHATIWGEHLYELEGFRPLIGDPAVAALKRGERIVVGAIPPLPRLSLRVRGQQPFAALEGLRAEVVDDPDGRLVVRCQSDDGLIQAFPLLNFQHERLEFDPFEQCRCVDDGSPKAIRNMIEVIALERALLVNGQFDIWNAETGALLGRTDPYVPVNIDIGATLDALQARVAELESEEQRRLAAAADATPER